MNYYCHCEFIVVVAVFVVAMTVEIKNLMKITQKKRKNEKTFFFIIIFMVESTI